jgi:hypothetical protein
MIAATGMKHRMAIGIMAFAPATRAVPAAQERGQPQNAAYHD